VSAITDLPFGFAITITGDTMLRTGVAATVSLAVANNTESSIPLATGADASAFELYMPTPDLFTADQLRAIKVSAAGWAAGPLADDMSITLTPTQAGTWASGQTITFTLTNVTSGAPPGNGNVMMVPVNLGDQAPPGLADGLTVADPPKPGNLQLTDVLQVTLDSQGTVLRSPSSTDPLNNTLYLTLKNIGATPLAAGGQRFGNPRVLVSFVYGNTSGALAPTTYDTNVGPQYGSAWKITAGIQSAQLPWTATQPTYVSQDQTPQWTLTPSPSNMTLLGAAGTAQANVTFTFSDIVTFAPAGHTQMLVLCTGFAKDATTSYDPHLFVLDIAKVDAPPTRGLLSFFGTDPVIPVSDPKSQISIPLRWSMFDVASVQLLSTSALAPAQTKKYALPPKPVDYDSSTVVLPAPSSSQAVFFTLQAFDAGGGYLNSQQFTAYAQVSYVTDTSGHVYPIALFGSTYWMMANYQLATPGSYDYGDLPENQATYGRLYDSTVLSQPPTGWQVPTVADWNALFAVFGNASQAYAALIAGGRSGFNAQLGGQRDPNGSPLYQYQYQYGFYWAADGMSVQFVGGSGGSGSASAGVAVPDSQVAMSVRFIRHA
jgi:uncharacterized protein (TIGR02145 family)